MTGKTITTIVAILLIIAGGFWYFGRDNGGLALDGNASTTAEDLTGTGGPDDGFDPFEDMDMEGKG